METQQAQQERLEYEKQYHNDLDKWHTEREKIRKKFSEGLFQIPLAYAWQSIDPENKDILDFGCGEGLASKTMIEKGAKSVHGIDISENMIEQAQKNCPQGNFQVMNAEELSFQDNSFDIIFGGAILHHLDLEKSLNHIRRVLRSGGVAIFVEPMGHNILVNWQRKKTPDARTPYEHPLLKQDIDLSRKIFTKVSVKAFFLFVLPFLALRTILPPTLYQTVFKAAYALDRFLLDLFPGIGHQSWMVVLQFTK